jgi:hypothetical protein
MYNIRHPEEGQRPVSKDAKACYFAGASMGIASAVVSTDGA